MSAPIKTALQRDETLPIHGAPRTEFDFPDTFDHSQIPLEKEEWPVIVVGSSMVGMSLQLMLGFHGVKSLSFDRHPSTATRTRAALFLLRSIEIFRQLSLEPALRAASATNFDLDSGMLLTTALLGGKTLGHVQESDPLRTSLITPCSRLWLTQNMYEPWVRERASALSAQQRFGSRVAFYSEDADGVLVVVQDVATRAYRKYRSRYLVACDGSRSPTRRKERVEWRGPGVLGGSISIYFRADLAALLGTRAKHGVTYVVNPRIQAVWRLDDSGRAGFLGVTGVEGRDGFEPDSVSEREAREMFALALGRGVEGLDMEIEEISYFTSAAYNSDCFASKQGRGRLFLAGDAAHVMPPAGGMGGNTGIQDAYNLAWKLALVVNGKASHGLLASYNSERQRVAGFTVQQAYSRLVNRVLKDPKLEHEKELPDDTVELGYRYPVGASVAEPGTDSSALWEDPYSPTATAGSRLPHVPLLSLSLDGISSLDLVKKHFVILAAETDSPWFDAAAKQDIPVQHYAICSQSKEACDPENRFRQLCGLQDGQALLVRPDGYIGWRAPTVEKGHEDRLKEILEQILRPKEHRR